MSLHDLSPWMDRAWHHAADRVRRRTPLLIRLGIATMIVTDSEAVRRQAIEYFRIHPDRIVAVPLAASPLFRRTAATLPTPTPYFLYVGALEPRKNLPLLLEAWRPVRDRHGIDLVLAGRRRKDFPELPAEPGLRILGELPDEALPDLYSRALAFVYPSHYEGFGIPLLEAMGCGAPAIATNVSSLPEVLGDAGLLVDSDSPHELAEALARVLGDDDLAARLRGRGLARAAEFTWERAARATLQVYREAAG